MGAPGPTLDPETRWETSAAVLDAVRRQPRMPVVDVGERIGGDPTSVDRVCFQLQRDGHVRALAGGEYSITARGEQRLRRLATGDH